jgi:hypothetical protein
MVKTREKFRQKLREGKLEHIQIEVEVEDSKFSGIGFLPGMGNEDIAIQIQDVFGNILPKKTKKRKLQSKRQENCLYKKKLKS